MPVHPQIAALLARNDPSPFAQPSIAEMRAVHDARGRLFGPKRQEVARVVDRMIPGPAGELHIRAFTPLGAAPGPLPVFVWLHGGGWALSNVEAYDPLCRILANESGCATVALDYRLAPEHKFPAAVEDSLATLRWVRDHGAEFGIDPGRIAVGGDSAGGNLAAVMAQICATAGEPRVGLQVLVYPCIDMAGDYPSMTENAEGYMLTRAALDWFYAQYLADPAQKLDPRASPLRAASVAGVAPALIITAEFDPLRDEGAAYAERLRGAGIAVAYSCYEGMVHPFLSFGGVVDAAGAAQRQIAAALKRAFGLR